MLLLLGLEGPDPTERLLPPRPTGPVLDSPGEVISAKFNDDSPAFKAESKACAA
jgi:hypothetical protein